MNRPPRQGFDPRNRGPRRPAPPQPSGAVPSGEQTLRGVITRVTFQNAESGHTIARFQAEKEGPGIKAGEEFVVTGPMPGAQPGESLEVTGRWTEHARYGTQFNVESYKQVPPATAEGIRNFLGSGLIAGIGKEYAGRIVEAFGEETLRVIDEAPDRLFEVEGIGPVRHGRIIEGWQEHREIAEIMAFLQSYGISATWSSRIYRTYGNDAVRVMRENPYRLALDLRGMGFHSADRIARAAGIAEDSPERMQAGILHLLREAAGKGHVFYPFDDLRNEAAELLGVTDAQRLREAVAAICRENASQNGALAVAEKLPEGDKAVYLKGLHHAEVNVASYVEAIRHSAGALPRANIDAELKRYEKDAHLELAPRQREAVALALGGGVAALTGGPGTGKTTTVRAVIEILHRHNVQVVLAAPTGRAAKRLSETTRCDAATVHRLLKWDPQEGGFAYNETNPLPVDYIVIDEASMLDVALTHQLLKAVPPTASILFVGDIDQLPSVGAGNVLADLIDSGAVGVVRLDTVFRQAQRSLIIRNAHRINAGEFPMLIDGETTEHGRPDFYFVEREEAEEAADAIVELVRDRIPSAWEFDAIRDVQVLTPMRRGILGANALNERLQNALNKDPRGVAHGSFQCRVGDKVMQCENNYDKDVYNGDIGIVSAIDRTDHFVRIRYDRRLVDYKFTELDELTLSYAITIHKSQGSEYPAVVVPIHTQHYIMLRRNLFYTAVTRGRRLVVCVGQKRAIALAVKNAEAGKRYSGLRQRLAGAETPDSAESDL